MGFPVIFSIPNLGGMLGYFGDASSLTLFSPRWSRQAVSGKLATQREQREREVMEPQLVLGREYLQRFVNDGWVQTQDYIQTAFLIKIWSFVDTG